MKLIYIIIPMALIACFVLMQIYYSYKEHKAIERRYRDKYPRVSNPPKVVDIQLDEFENHLS